MTTPSGLTTEDVARILTKISRRVARKYMFGYHSYEDIVQVGIQKALEALEAGKYQPHLYHKDGCDNSAETSLARFMSIHIPNRLHNYKRDNSRRNVEVEYEANTAKYNIMNPISIGDNMGPGVVVDYEGEVDYADTLGRIKKGLVGNQEMLADFQRLLDGAFVPSHRKTKLRQRIGEILGRSQYGETQEDD